MPKFVQRTLGSISLWTCLSLSVAAGDRSSNYRELGLPEIPLTASSVLALLDDFFRLYEIEAPEIEVHISDWENEPKTYIDIILRGYLDDSLLGEEYRLTLFEDGSRFQLQRIELRYICARGPSAGRAQIGYCP